MRLATALVHDRLAFGPIIDNELCDVSDSGMWPGLAEALPADQRATLDRVAHGSPRFPLSGIRLLPPIPSPQRILCMGLNYREHAAESDLRLADSPFPVVFVRFGRDPRYPRRAGGMTGPAPVLALACRRQHSARRTCGS